MSSIDDFEKQHDKARVAQDEFKVDGDGVLPMNNARVVMSLIDRFMHFPCMPDEHQNAFRMRKEWARLNALPDDWSTWSTADMEKLLMYLVALINTMDEAAEPLSATIVLRKLVGRK